MIGAALGALGTLAAIFCAAIYAAWKLANFICDYIEKGRG